MLSRPSSLDGLIRQSAALRSTSRHPTVIGRVFGIPGSSCPSSTPSGLSLPNCSELPPLTSAGSLMRALPSSFRTSTGHRVGEGNAWHSEYPATNSALGGGNPPCSSRSPHYPSWGSETPRRGARARLGTDLITPHGDRKRSARVPICMWARRSLPLMGIGNTVRVTGPEGLSMSSLPLMGIGNQRTTRPPTRMTNRPHYPSWGSET